MTQTEASPSIVGRGTREPKRITLTRGELIKILCDFVDFVKDREAKDFPAWVDGVFNAAERDGAIVFDSQAKAGERFTVENEKDDGLWQSLASELRDFNLGKEGE